MTQRHTKMSTEQLDPTKEFVNETRNLVSGTIDKAIDTTGQLAANQKLHLKIQKVFQFIRNRQWASTFRPLTEFFSPMEFSRPKPNKIWKRLECNLQHFFTNYVLMIIIIFSFSILTKPWLFFGILIIAYIWTMVASRDSITVGPIKLDGNRKFGALCLFTVCAMLLLGFHEIIFISLGIGSILCSAHAIFHNIPDCMLDDENDFAVLGSNLLNV